MSSEPVAVRSGLVERARNIMLTPQAEWDRIAAEPASPNALFMGYLLPLALLSAVCGVVGWVVFGVGGFGFSVRLPLVPALVNGALQVVMSLVGAFVLALIIDGLAPSFGATKGQAQAQKLAVYSSTPGLLAGVFALYPPLSILSIVGLYALALLYIGLPRLMKAPEDKRLGYFVAIIICSIILGFIGLAVMGAVRTAAGGWPVPGINVSQPGGPINAQINLPGGGSVNVNELQKMGEAASQAASQAAASGASVAVDPTQLQGILPPSLPGGFARTSMSSGAAMGMTNAAAEYARGDARMTLTLTQMGAMGGLAMMAGAANVQQSREDADGYERTNTINGRLVTESVSRSSNSASYAIVGRGVTIAVEGAGVTIDEVHAAANSVGIERLEQAFGK